MERVRGEGRDQSMQSGMETDREREKKKRDALVFLYRKERRHYE